MMIPQDTEVSNLVDDGVQKAVIIDQLHEEIPNELFQQQARELLEGAGYQVDIFTTKDITVDFYKKLPSMNYKYVVIRTHGATDESEQNSVTIFTGEKYQSQKYIPEQIFGQVKRATPLANVLFKVSESTSVDLNVVNSTYREITIDAEPIYEENPDEYFAITPKLVDELMVGKFSDSFFLIGGCNSLENPSMAQALIERGASSVVGWDDAIDSDVNDQGMLLFLKMNLVENMNIDESVGSVVKYYNQFPWYSPYNGTLTYYPNSNL